MAFLCPARIRRAKKKRGRKDPPPPLPGRITGSTSIDTLVRVGLEKEDFLSQGGQGRQKMVVLHDFMPCVEDELSVKSGETVTILYQENDWVYVLAGDGREGFIPFVYCVPMGRSIDDLHASRRKLHPNNQGNTADVASTNNPSCQPAHSLPSLQEAPEHSGPYEEPSDASSQAPLLTRQDSDERGSRGQQQQQAHWPRYENLVDHCHRDNGGIVNLAASTSTLELVDIGTFHKEASGRSIVLFSYRANEEGDVDVDRGDFVTILNIDDPDWYWVSKTDGSEGFVPSNFLCPAEGAMTTGKLEQQTATSTGSSAASICSQPPLSEPVELVVLYDYSAQAPDDVSVTRGEWVYANLADQPEPDWLWVYAPATSKFGFIPKEFAKPPSIIRNTTTRRSNAEKTLNRSGTRGIPAGGLRRTMSLSEKRNQMPLDPYLSP